MSNEIQIFQMDDTEWWIGAGTPEEMLAAFIEEYGEDAFPVEREMPRPLTDKELDSIPFHYDYDEETGVDKKKIRTFREQLAIEIAEGVPAPRMFASTEW